MGCPKSWQPSCRGAGARPQVGARGSTSVPFPLTTPALVALLPSPLSVGSISSRGSSQPPEAGCLPRTSSSARALRTIRCWRLSDVSLSPDPTAIRLCNQPQAPQILRVPTSSPSPVSSAKWPTLHSVTLARNLCASWAPHSAAFPHLTGHQMLTILPLKTCVSWPTCT